MTKHINKNIWLECDNVQDAIKKTRCSQSTIYNSITNDIYINE